MPPLVRLVHPAPAFAVVGLSAVLAGILLLQAGELRLDRLVLTTLAVAGSQVLTGALNDWADRDRDARAQPDKPIPAGLVSPPTALTVAGVGAAVQLAASVPLGGMAVLLGAIASTSAVSYDLWLSRTPASVVPYLISFGTLPAWIAAGVGVPLERVAAAVLLVAPFAAAAHLANTVRDDAADAALGSRSLGQVLGPRVAFALAWGLAMAVGVGVGIALALGGRMTPAAAVPGLIGLVAVAQGAAGPNRLWIGMLVAAVCWVAAWALATG